MYELTKEFAFDAAHTLNRKIQIESSRRIHGHSYRAAVTLAGDVDPDTGMLVDLGHLDTALAILREELDHRFLDEVTGLGTPTMENLCAFIWRRLKPKHPELVEVTVRRDSIGETCRYRPRAPQVAFDEPTLADALAI